jgi:hypothetical protein
MINFTEYPVRHIDGNLTFGNDGTVWAYYLIKGFGYEHLDEQGQKAPFFSQLNFLSKNKSDLHFVVIPTPMNSDHILNATVRELERKNYALQQNGINFMKASKEALKKHQTEKNSIEYHALLGLQIRDGHNHLKENNRGNTIVKNIVDLVKGFASPLYQAVGLYPGDYLQSEIDTYHKEASNLHRMLEDNFGCKVEKPTSTQMVYFSEQNYSVGREITLRPDFESAEIVEGTIKEKKYKAKRPNKKAFHDIQNAEVQEYDRTTLLVQRLVNQDIEETYVQYLACHKINGFPAHPGWEWLYTLQNELEFPVTYSIRAEYVPNDKTKAALSNKLLVIADQEKEALNAGANPGNDVKKAEQNGIKFQDLFSETEWPSYNCSFLFRVAANDRATLKRRVEDLQDKLGKYHIEVVSPFGEQLNYFLESIIGSKRYNRDYTKPVAPNVLAGMMFGATTNIGDGRGFYFAQTIKQNKPVFIQLDLAAKNYTHIQNLYDSLAIMVAGATGKGKSVLMNLLSYLAVLMGSISLIIDPKGDRKKWAQGLPYIPKEYINVWTLGAVEEDTGCLDPFRICETIGEARDLAMEIISHCQNIEPGSFDYVVLGEILGEAIEKYEPCLGAVKKHADEKVKQTSIDNPYHKNYFRVAGALREIKQNNLGKLLFSDIGQQTKVLSIDTPLQVLMIEKLQLPENGKPATTPQGKFSEVIMIGLTAFAKRFMLNSERSVHKIILQDEASSVERSETGAQLLDFVVRKGRYYNTTLLKGSQNSTDFSADTNNIGMKFSFALNNEKEAVEMLKYFNLPVTNENVEQLRSMRKGECFFQDIYGRTAKIYINPLFKQVLDAFDSSTSTKEERAHEEERILEGVM